MARVELKNLRKEWLGATPAVAGVDLAIEDGAFVAVLGPSGCGKTTTLMMLAGIYQPTSGEITFRSRSRVRADMRPALRGPVKIVCTLMA